jgi:hypothetical protein
MDFNNLVTLFEKEGYMFYKSGSRYIANDGDNKVWFKSLSEAQEWLNGH